MILIIASVSFYFPNKLNRYFLGNSTLLFKTCTKQSKTVCTVSIGAFQGFPSLRKVSENRQGVGNRTDWVGTRKRGREVGW